MTILKPIDIVLIAIILATDLPSTYLSLWGHCYSALHRSWLPQGDGYGLDHLGGSHALDACDT